MHRIAIRFGAKRLGARMNFDPSARKAAIRARALTRRDSVDLDARAHFSHRIAHLGAALVAANQFQDVALFTPIRGEPDCLPLAAALCAAGVRTLLPAVAGGGLATVLAFRPWRIGDPLIPGPVGAVPEPPASRGEATPDFILAPCAAFDRAGRRIGYGRGHYDATLAALRARTRIVALAVAFACQEVEEAPAEAHDEPIDGVLTERELLFFTAPGKALHAATLHR